MQGVRVPQFLLLIGFIVLCTLLLIGFYQFENIKSETLINSIKDALCRIDIPLRDCKVQCLDGASCMVGAKTELITRINETDSRAYLTHCHGHALQLAIGNTIKAKKINQRHS